MPVLFLGVYEFRLCSKHLASLHLVVDIDECASATLNGCRLNETCVNTDGSFHCPCIDHFKFDPAMNRCLGE